MIEMNTINKRSNEINNICNDKCKILFFDNDNKNIMDFNTLFGTDIYSVLIDDKEPNYIFGDKNSYLSNYLLTYPKNTYAQYLRNVSAKEVATNNGISKTYINAINHWASQEIDTKTIIFDWDRTLSVVEGVFLNTYGTKEENKLEYIMGGAERLSQLREMFDILNQNSVTIFIITNNTSFLHEDSSAIFLNMVTSLSPHIKPEQVLYNFVNDKAKLFKLFVTHHKHKYMDIYNHLYQSKKTTAGSNKTKSMKPRKRGIASNHRKTRIHKKSTNNNKSIKTT